MDYTTLIIAVIGSQGLWALILQLMNNSRDRKNKKEEKEDKTSEIVESINTINEKISEIELKLESNTELTKADVRDRLNHLCERYMRIGFIPMNEFVAWKALGESYISAGGNTDVKTKFLWCCDNLTVENERG